MKTINIGIHEADKQNQRGRVGRLLCSVPEGKCPFLEEKTCIRFGILPHGCPYGKSSWTSSGVTKRAAAYREWSKKAHAEQEAFYAENPRLNYAKPRVAVVGDYVYVPTPHADMNEKVPFVSRGSIVSTGTPFVKREEFTPEVVLEIANFVPRTIFDRVPIASYQKEEVPKFLYQLKQALPEIYAAAARLDPTLENRILKVDDFVGRQISVIELPPGEIDVVVDDKSRRTVRMTWDGKRLSGTIPRSDAHGMLWLRAADEPVEVSFAPAEKLKATPSREVVESMFAEGKLKA